MDQILMIVAITAACLVAIAAIQAAVSFRFFSAAGRVLSKAAFPVAAVVSAEAPPAPSYAAPQPVAAAAAAIVSPPTAPAPKPLLNLSGVDEKTAAMLMAIVADEIGLAPDELDYLSIRECK